ncbi:F-box domain-containing protein [Mycena indigotica]|uniref:F-box domain-containing protein n=1 Tax=Mycena indigotica TaxID=2126181 RepID=A0A8H6W1Z2_9AGAR|nr:F-box domain-containing protein [Mycena indigotica]KAF7298713.1 F-box domain-containing protein [Mycena indigotica]
MTSLAGWPDDVLLRLGQELDICDLISFLATCRALRALQDYRTLWITAVHRIRYTQLHPLPLAQNESISSLPLARLQILARQTNRLLRNWHSDAPRPAWTRSFSIGQGPIFCIPGTYLVATLPHLLVVVVADPCMSVEGRAMLGGTVRLPDNGIMPSLAVIVLDFADNTNIRFDAFISPPISIASQNPANFFLNDKLIGFTTGRAFYYWKFDRESAVRGIPNPWSSMLYEGQLDTQSISVHTQSISVHVSSDGLLRLRMFSITSGGDAIVDSIALDVDSHSVDPASGSQLILLSEEEREACLRHNLNTNRMWHFSPLVVRPDYGVYGVSRRGFNADRDGPTFSFTHFWPAPLSGCSSAEGCETADPTSQTSDSGPHAPRPRSVCHIHPSKLLAHATGVSGRYVLQVVAHPDGPSYTWRKTSDRQLALVFLDSDGECQFRELHFEGEAARCLDADRGPPQGLALDETLGLVMVLDRAGMLTVASYM